MLFLIFSLFKGLLDSFLALLKTLDLRLVLGKLVFLSASLESLLLELLSQTFHLDLDVLACQLFSLGLLLALLAELCHLSLNLGYFLFFLSQLLTSSLELLLLRIFLRGRSCEGLSSIRSDEGMSALGRLVTRPSSGCLSLC